MQPIFVTGTDTGVGKTTIAAHLVKQLRAAGFDAGYWKPIETDAPSGASADVDYVRQICGDDVPATCSLTLPEPLAPNVAAKLAGVAIDLDDVHVDQARLAKMYRPLVIEGAGGLLVRVTDDVTFADLALQWQASVLLVIGNKLGCLNHAMLTIAELGRRQLDLGGWVLNDIAAEATPASQTNLAELTRLIGTPPLAHVAFGRVEDARLIGM